MDNNEIKNNIAYNLTRYRTLSGFTQSELAAKINYSDKSVSKWERAEGTPDVFVLKKLAEIYGIKVDDFLLAKDSEKAPLNGFKLTKRKRLIINILSIALVWLVAVTVYFLLNIILGFMQVPTSQCFVVFIYAIPLSAIVQVVFSNIWWNDISAFIASSLIIWGLVLSIFLSFVVFDFQTVGTWTIFLVAAVLQVMTCLWFVLRYLKRKSSINR